jgi:hypothetical protein
VKTYIGHDFGARDSTIYGAGMQEYDESPPSKGGWSGIAYVYGKSYDFNGQSGLRLRVQRAGSLSAIEVELTNSPIPDPMPPNESWRELSQCYGDIYIDS